MEEGSSRICSDVFGFLKVEIKRCRNRMWSFLRIKLGDSRYCTMIMIRSTIYYMLV